jgi:hypothetical protein
MLGLMTRPDLIDIEFGVKSERTNNNEIENVKEHPKTTLGDLQGDHSEV